MLNEFNYQRLHNNSLKQNNLNFFGSRLNDLILIKIPI